MKNWTDSCINWNQLPGTEVKRLIDTWGKDEAFIAKYDKRHGFVHSPLSVAPVKPHMSNTKNPVDFPKPAAKKVVAARQRHTGADGEIKFVEHRNLYVGFWGGRVVVTKRTREACAEYLQVTHGVEE